MLNFLHHLSIKQKMLSGFVVIFAIIIAIGLIISSGLFKINHAVQQMVHQQQPATLATLHISDALKDTLSSLSLFLLSKEPYHQTQYQEKLNTQAALLKQLQTHLSQNANTDNQQQLSHLEQNLAQLKTVQETLLSLAQNDLDNFPAMRYSAQNLSPINQSAAQNISTLIDAEQAEERKDHKQQQTLLNQFYTLRDNWNKIINNVRAYLSFRTAETITETKLYQESLVSQLGQIKQKYSALLTLEQTDALEQLMTLQQQYAEHLEATITLHSGEKWRQDAFIIRTQLTPLLKSTHQQIDTLVSQQQTAINQVSAALIEQTVHITELIVGLLLVALLSIGFLYRVLMQDIITPISQAVDTGINAISTVIASFLGNTQTLTATASSRDEIGKVAETFTLLSTTLQQAAQQQNQHTQQLQAKVEQILSVVSRAAIGDLTGVLAVNGNEHIDHLASGVKQMIGNLHTLVQELQQSGHQVSSSVVDIATTAKQQEATVAEQAATTHEIMSSSKTISQTAQQLLTTMNQVSQVAQESTEAANNGHHALIRMEQTLQDIGTASGEINSKLSVLNEKANNINSVITIINKVADQTNLLSLNAAIEAEKAGEYGAGFSVVASEIRRLSDQTTEATWDIEQTVKEMQSAVSAGVIGMDLFAEKMRRGVDDAHQVGEQLGRIIAHIETLVPQFHTVHTAMHAQTESAQQISEAMEQLGEAAQQTAESLRTSNRSIQQLNQIAHILNDKVSFFNVKSGG